MRAPSCANAPDGATGRDRTGHLRVTNALLCRMSYSGSRAGFESCVSRLFLHFLDELVNVVVLMGFINIRTLRSVVGCTNREEIYYTRYYK